MAVRKKGVTVTIPFDGSCEEACNALKDILAATRELEVLCKNIKRVLGTTVWVEEE